MLSDRLVVYAHLVVVKLVMREWADKLNVFKKRCCCRAECKAFWDTTRQPKQREAPFT